MGLVGRGLPPHAGAVVYLFVRPGAMPQAGIGCPRWGKWVGSGAPAGAAIADGGMVSGFDEERGDFVVFEGGVVVEREGAAGEVAADGGGDDEVVAVV